MSPPLLKKSELPILTTSKKLQSAEVSNEYWNLLKSSKSKVKDTKDGVDTMVSLNNKWNKILILRNEGQTLSEDQKEFMTDYISDEFKEYFTTNVGLKNENYQWQKFNKKLVDLYSKHLKKKEKSVAGAQSNNNDSSVSINAKDIAFAAVGLLLAIVGVVLLILEKRVKSVGWGIAALIIGFCLLAYGVYKMCSTYNEYYSPSNNSTTAYDPPTSKNYQSLDDAEEDMKDNVPLLSEIEPSPPPSLKILETFFVKLENEIKAEKSENQFFQSLQKEVVQIINSLKTLQDECEALVQQIGTAQNYARV